VPGPSVHVPEPPDMLVCMMNTSPAVVKLDGLDPPPPEELFQLDNWDGSPVPWEYHVAANVAVLRKQQKNRAQNFFIFIFFGLNNK
jgi:hypothetical protein